MSWGPPACTEPHGAGTAPRPGNRFNHLGCSVLTERRGKGLKGKMEGDGVGGRKACPSPVCVWLTEWLRSVPNEGQVSFVVPLAHPLFSMCPEARDLNTCKRATQLWFPGCLEAAACSPSSKKGGSRICTLICDDLQLQGPHLSKEARAKSEPKPEPCSHKITPGSFFYLFYLPVALL